MLTLLLCTASSLPGRVISLVENDQVVHVALANGDYAVAEEPCGLWLRPSAQYDARARRWPLPLTEMQAVTAWAWLMQRVGSRYGYAAVLVDGLMLLGHVHLAQPATGNEYDCSGAIAAALAVAGYAPFAPADPRGVTPADWDRLTRV